MYFRTQGKKSTNPQKFCKFVQKGNGHKSQTDIICTYI